MAKALLLPLGGILAAVVLVKVLVLLIEPRLAFYPVRGEDITPRALGIGYEEIALRTADGETVYAWLLEHPEPVAEVLFWHGNGGNLSVWLDVLAGIHEQGFRVVALDYRGYGKSTGRPSEKGLYRDTEALVQRFTTGLHRPGSKVVYWGRSLGAAVAAYATTLAEPDGIILEAAFPDARAIVRRDPLLAVLSIFSTYRFPTGEFLRDFRGPVLLLHPEHDSVVPLELGRRLYANLAGEKRFVTIAGADHNDVMAADRPDYWGPVLEFIEELPVR